LRTRGFTLVELLIVIAIIAIASSVASLALRDSDATRLDEEAVRLAALLEGARADARAAGLRAHWEPGREGEGFRFVGLPGGEPLPTNWLYPGVSAEIVGARAVVLGPEPIIGAQRVVLRLEQRRVTVATDGLGPFAVAEEASP
jgi:general secretion pathway protein H